MNRIYIIGILIFVNYSACTKLPSYMKPCGKSLDRSELTSCILKEARRTLKEFCKGIPELGVEPMDPMNVGEYKINTATVKIVQRNLIIKGSCNAFIKEIDMSKDAESGRIVLNGNFSTTSDYDITGILMFFPINGKGKFRVKMDNTEIAIDFKTTLATLADNKKHYVIHDFKSSHNIGSAKIRMNGLFGSDPNFEKTVNQVLNENWRELMNEFGPPSVDAVAKKTIEIINYFYAAVPYDELFV